MGLAQAGAIGLCDGLPNSPPQIATRLARPIPSFSKINLTADRRF